MNISDRLLQLTKKWWFYTIIIVLNLVIYPYASKNFSFEKITDIISTTLRYSLYNTSWKNIYTPFQIIFIVMTITLFICKDKFSKYFIAFVALSYILYAIGQNIAITDKYGLSIITTNVFMFSLISFVWILDLYERKTIFKFNNFRLRYLWMVVFSAIAFWVPLNIQTLTPEFNISQPLTNGSSLAFCLTTPLFLTLLTLNLPDTNIVTYRITAFIGLILGIPSIRK